MRWTILRISEIRIMDHGARLLAREYEASKGKVDRCDHRNMFIKVGMQLHVVRRTAAKFIVTNQQKE
jgi:hypothetical protein